MAPAAPDLKGKVALVSMRAPTLLVLLGVLAGGLAFFSKLLQCSTIELVSGNHTCSSCCGATSIMALNDHNAPQPTSFCTGHKHLTAGHRCD